jgi:hypothetical protein
MISLKRYHALFLHPNLKALTISCASTDYVDRLPQALMSDLSDMRLTRSTKLEYLHLEECDLEANSLRRLLRLSHSLKSLKISEGIRYAHRMHGDIAPDAIVEAVAKYCSKSLNDLSLQLGFIRPRGHPITQRGYHLNLTPFDNLRTLSLDFRTSALIRTVPCDHGQYRRLPPSLEALKIFDIHLSARPRPFRARFEAYMPLSTCFVSEKQKHGVPNLKRLTYSYKYTDADENASIASSDASNESVENIPQVPLAQNQLLRECVKQQPLFKAANVCLTVEMVMLPTGFIPPYLYFEEKPSTSVFWSSDQDGADSTLGKGQL